MRYAIWNKRDDIITPVGEVLSAGQWINRYPVAGKEDLHVVCSAGVVNGGFFGILEQMVQMYEEHGCDFSGCTTAEEKLRVIEEHDAAASAASSEASTDELTAASLASIAASLEYQNMMSLEDVTV